MTSLPSLYLCLSRFICKHNSGLTKLMATIPTFISKPLPSHFSVAKPRFSLRPPHSSALSFNKRLSRTLILHASSPSSSSQVTQNNPSTSDANENKEERIHQIHSIEEFDVALKAAKNRLVVVEYNAKQKSTINGIEEETEGINQWISLKDYRKTSGHFNYNQWVAHSQQVHQT